MLICRVGRSTLSRVLKNLMLRGRSHGFYSRKGKSRVWTPRDLILVPLPKIPDSSGFSKLVKVWISPPDISSSIGNSHKRRQFTEITRITNNLNEDEILIHLDYSENYKCQHQNEIQSAYFGKKNIWSSYCLYVSQTK